MTFERTTTEAGSIDGAASALDVKLGELIAELDSAKLYSSRGEESSLPEDAADALRKLQASNAHMRNTVAALAALAQHSDDCLWATQLPTGIGYWGCSCGLDNLVLDGEPTDAALESPNAKSTGAARHERE